MNNMYEYEENLYKEGYNFIAGTDEAGRGPLVGPVVAGCVVFPKGYKNDLINDSKKLTEKKREQLYDIIIKDAVTYGIGIVSAKEIDELNIYEASRKAIIKAYEEANKKVNTLIKQFAEQENVNEELKANNQLEWVQRMNNIKNRAEEIVLNESIYV